MFAVFEEFHKYCKFEKSLNSSFIALILKSNAINVRDFRPISLTRSVLKLWLSCWQID